MLPGLRLPIILLHASGAASVETRLEMPAWLVWVTGAAVVALSFAVVGAFLSRPTSGAERPADRGAPRLPLPAWARAALAALGVLALALLVANALGAGGASVFPDVVVFLVLWAALPIVAYAVGDAWRPLSPFRALAPLADRLRGGRAPLAYPRALGSWPAVALLVALTGYEVWDGPARGGEWLARAAAAYAALTFAGMAAFGSDAWLARAEVFGRAFRWWSAFSPSAGGPVEGLRRLPVADASDVAFTVALLYGVNFDGFLATAPGRAALGALEPAVGAAGAHVVVLLLGFAVFLGAFWLCARYVRRASESLEPTAVVAARFAASLVPIAVAYHVAHNLFYVWENAPRVLLALLDPLGLGWAPAGLGTSLPLPAPLLPLLGGAQVVLIVAGHVVAVVVAHRLAFDHFASRVQAIRSELPLTAAMVFYTLVGLWILSSGGHGGVTA